MVNKLMVTYMGFNFLFFGMGGLILGFSLMSEQQNRSAPTIDSVAKELLLRQCPLRGKTGRFGTMEYLQATSLAARKYRKTLACWKE